MKNKLILLVEDDPRDRALMLLALEKGGIVCDVDVVGDGAEFMDYMFGTGSYRDRDATRIPHVVLLDLKMPKLNGLQVLQVLRRAHSDQGRTGPPVVVLTSSDHEEDILESYRLGAHGYVRKPVDFGRFVEVVQQISTYWLHVNRPPLKAELGNRHQSSMRVL